MVPIVLRCSSCDARPPLCDVCVDNLLAQLIGIARARGYWWGRAVRTVMRGQAWPTYETSARVQDIAQRKIADLTEDVRLADRLARACAAAARDAYEDETPVPGERSFTTGTRSRR